MKKRTIDSLIEIVVSISLILAFSFLVAIIAFMLDEEADRIFYEVLINALLIFFSAISLLLLLKIIFRIIEDRNIKNKKQ